MPPTNLIPKPRTKDIVVQEFANEVLIYDLKTDKAFCLNETSALVWQACDGHKNIDEIVEIVRQKLNSPSNKDLVWFAINQLKKEKLLENGNEMPDYFAGMTRREMVKKVGLGTMTALPIIASLVAPTSVQAGLSVMACTLTCTTIVMGVRQNCNCAATPSGQRDRGCQCTAVAQCCPGLMCSNVPDDGTGGDVCNNGTMGNI